MADDGPWSAFPADPLVRVGVSAPEFGGERETWVVSVVKFGPAWDAREIEALLTPLFEESAESYAHAESSDMLADLRMMSFWFAQAVAGGVAGNLATDALKLLLAREDKSNAQRTLDREYAHHMAQWYVASEYALTGTKFDLDDILRCIEEERVDESRWRFKFILPFDAFDRIKPLLRAPELTGRYAGWTFTVELAQDVGPHAMIARILAQAPVA